MKRPLHPWECPNKPWGRLHIDYAGPMDGRMFLVLVDAYSKWMEVIPTSGCTSKITIIKLKGVFCTHGLPDVIVSDNGAAFTSEEFKTFINRNGIRHITGAPYHPSTNGLAENAVKTFKQAVKKMEGVLEDSLHKFLFNYRITPHATTGVPPCELLMKRKIKSRFDLLRPSIENHVAKKQELQAKYFSENQEFRLSPSLSVGDHVYFRNYSRSGPPNIPGMVEEKTGPLSYKVRSEDSTLVW